MKWGAIQEDFLKVRAQEEEDVSGAESRLPADGGALVGRSERNSVLVCRAGKWTGLALGCLFQGESEMRT